jgi:ParB/RepB/Spo0J family partition protein
MSATRRVAEQVVYLPLDRLRVAATNPRKTQAQRSPGHVPLRDSIKAQGILNPLVVVPAGEHFDVVCGYRRLTAARELKLEDAPCIVRPMTRLQQLELGVTDNINRGLMDPVDIGLALIALRDEGLSQQVIAMRIGRSQTYVSHRIRIASMPAAVRQQIKRKQLTVSSALGHDLRVPKTSVFEAGEALQKSWLELRSVAIETGDRRVLLALQRFAGSWRVFTQAKKDAIVA